MSEFTVYPGLLDTRGPLRRSIFSSSLTGSFLVGLLLASMFASVVQAQVSTAAIVGTTTDSSGAIVPGVKVTATNLATNLTYTGETNNRGEFVIPVLPPGQYKVQCEITGFKT